MSYKSKEQQQEYARQHYLANKELYKARSIESNKQQRIRNKELVKKYLLTNPCVDCGNSDVRVLQFDHKDRSEKLTNISRLLNSRKQLIAEIKKCDVRCANCHMIRTAEQFGWERVWYV